MVKCVNFGKFNYYNIRKLLYIYVVRVLNK